jgi:hypothetical protein
MFFKTVCMSENPDGTPVRRELRDQAHVAAVAFKRIFKKATRADQQAGGFACSLLKSTNWDCTNKEIACRTEDEQRRSAVSQSWNHHMLSLIKFSSVICFISVVVVQQCYLFDKRIDIAQTTFALGF